MATKSYLTGMPRIRHNCGTCAGNMCTAADMSDTSGHPCKKWVPDDWLYEQLVKKALIRKEPLVINISRSEYNEGVTLKARIARAATYFSA